MAMPYRGTLRDFFLYNNIRFGEWLFTTQGSVKIFKNVYANIKFWVFS